ncbi:MAG TPA: hypothetical protein VFX70_17960 [Mycobacteriales bacterium]|nr:hypothetical protein [Mycobacteriales bacterium]
MPDNAAVDALLLTAALAVLVLLALAPAIRVRTGPRLPEGVRNQRVELLLTSLATAPARRDGFVDARSMVWECGRNGRERYQVVRDLVDRDWAEQRGRAGLALIPAFLRLTSTGWWEWGYRRAAPVETKPKPPTVTYLNFRRLVPTGVRPPRADRPGGRAPGRDGVDTGEVVVSGPSEQNLRELYVALRADAENILARGLRQDTLDRADEVERAVDEPDTKKRWAVVDHVGPLVALDPNSFTLTVMVLKRLLS